MSIGISVRIGNCFFETMVYCSSESLNVTAFVSDEHNMFEFTFCNNISEHEVVEFSSNLDWQTMQLHFRYENHDRTQIHFVSPHKFLDQQIFLLATR